jgi:hypothetical protein
MVVAGLCNPNDGELAGQALRMERKSMNRLVRVWAVMPALGVVLGGEGASEATPALSDPLATRETV